MDFHYFGQLMIEFQEKIHGKNFYRKKIYARFFFRFRDFRFKIRFEAFWIETNPKKFWLKFFDCHFFTILAEKRLSQSKKKYTGKKFRLQDVRFKIRFETFWVDSEQKFFFDQNSLPLSFFHYFGYFGRKTTKSHEKNLHGKKFSISRFSF